MATTGPSTQPAGVLLVDADTLLLQGDNEEDPTDVTADLLQQALQGASALNASDASSHGDGEVKFEGLQENTSDVVAIFQGDSGETHTIKMTREQLESLGLHLESKSTSGANESNANINVVTSVTTATPTPAVSLMTPHGSLLPMVPDNLLSSLPNMVTDGRIIDEEGNIVQADDMQILPNSLSSFMDQDVGQAITIVPQYGMDGMVTYAVKLKDANDLTSSDYALSSANVITRKEDEPKTGLDIEVEMARANVKKTLTPLEEAMGPISIPISSSASVPISTAISIPTLPLTATIPRVTNSNKFVSVVPSSTSTPIQNSYFRILPDRSAMNIGAIASAVQPSVDMQPIQNNLTNIVPDSVPRPAVSKLQSSIAFPITASNLNSSLGSGRSFNVSSNSQLGLNVFSIMNPSNVVPTTSTSTFRNIASTNMSMKPPMRPAQPRVSTLQTTTSRLLPITSTKVTSVNVIPSQPTTIMTSATTTQPAIGAAAITKVCQPITAAGSRAPNHLNTKPLGSSENPIQLVQQGQTFHSMQALSQSQLHQIATVLQQKHIGGMPKKNVVFDEQTKTRIVYRVVYPEDVDLQQPNSPIEGRDASAFRTTTIQPVKPKPRGRGRPAKNTRTHIQQSQTDSQTADGEDDDKGAEDSKGDRKKIVARTRSGRLSRPPRHMLKDYKRLHHLDFWEPDVDDSDGGYSDYLTATDPNAPQTASQAGDAVNGAAVNASATVPMEEDSANKEKELLKGLIPVKRRVSSRFSCPTCQKIYLGHTRMARHFQRFPDHGSIEEFNQNRREEIKEAGGDDAQKPSVTDMKRRGARGRKRAHWAQRTPQERSEQRKNKLRQMIATCEPQELVEVVGPLIARTLTLWDLLLLRLESMDRPNAKLKPGEAEPKSETSPAVGSADGASENSERANSNRVAWLLVELRSLLDSVQSIAGDLLKPHGDSDGSAENVVEIAEQALSNMLGMACGTYVANDQLLHAQREDDAPPEPKRTRLESQHELAVPDTDVCPDVEMASKEDANKSLSPIKLPDDIPFLNSSDDMICAGDDPDASTDGKHCDDSEAAANLQTVDDIVNERLKNLEENMNFSVGLAPQMETPITNPPPNLLIGDFSDSTTSLSVNNTSVITSVPDNGASVGSIDLMNTYDSSMTSLTGAVPITGGVTTSNNDLATGQEMLSSYSMALSSLMSIPSALQVEPTSSVTHSADSFLESLSSFEPPSCTDPGVSYGDSVLKDEPVLPLSTEPPPQRRQSPPKFISTFTPAETNGKLSEPITTAQRLQRDYRFSERAMGLELDGGLDVGLDTDLDFDALTEEFNRNTQD